MRHSWIRLLGSLVVVLGLVGPVQAADWSAYIDRDARPTAAQAAPAQKRAKVSKRSTKKVAKAKARAKARSKSKARRK